MSNFSSLDKLFPTETKVKLGLIDHEFTVQKLTLEVDAWMKQEFGTTQRASELFK